MGIPSYYKRLYDAYPNLVQRRVANAGADILCFDFNCLIYACARGPAMPKFSSETREAWEAALLLEIKKYVLKVWEIAGRPREVFLAVDGVVPMAKIRQQRLRRFKSIWLAGKEVEAGVRAGESWDTNSITPGTEFMDRLTTSLKALGAARGWTISGVDEPGEGEQKLMAWLRAKGTLAGKQICIYGLDADLIVLSLLHLVGVGADCKGWKLLRETMEFGMGKAETDQFSLFDCRLLAGILCGADLQEPVARAVFLEDYICAMSLLGNDFLPHSLSIHIREGGHDELLKQLRVPGRKRLYNGDAVNLEAVLDLIRPWAAVEEEAIAEHFRDKYSGRGPPARTPYDKAMSAANRLPIEWAEEACVWTKEGGLIPEWREISYRKWMRDSNLQTMCREFCIGLQWIMDYYHGLDVSYEWYFPWSLPPYWTDLVKYLEGEVDLTMPAPTDPLKPQEQLALVLPQASWHLLRDRKLSMLPSLIPQYWPKGFTFFSAGRKLLWECEPEIPILTAARMRGVLT